MQRSVHTLGEHLEDILEEFHDLDEVTKKIIDILAASFELAVQRPEVKQAFIGLICSGIVSILHRTAYWSMRNRKYH